MYCTMYIYFYVCILLNVKIRERFSFLCRRIKVKRVSWTYFHVMTYTVN